MTILRRIGSMAIIPGTPTIPAVPGYYRKKFVPDPPSNTTAIFDANFGRVGIPMSALFPGGTIIVSEDPPATSRVPVEPSIERVDYYNGQRGTFLIVTFPDGRRMVVKQ